MMGSNVSRLLWDLMNKYRAACSANARSSVVKSLAKARKALFTAIRKQSGEKHDL